MPKSPDRCKEERKEMKNRILHNSMLYFAKNGFAGTRISDLAKHIGIAQGTLYLYFKSKEDLFNEIQNTIKLDKDIKDIKLLSVLPLTGKQKIHKLSKEIIQRFEKEENFAEKITLSSQTSFEASHTLSSDTALYDSDLYKETEKLILQGQKEGTVIDGASMKLTDFYWSVVYLYALKKLFTTQFEMITIHDLERIVLKDKNNK